MPETGARRLVWIDLDLDGVDGLPLPVAHGLHLTDDPDRSERILEERGRAGWHAGDGRIHLTLIAMEPSTKERGKDDPLAPDLLAREVDLVAVPGLVVSLHRGPVRAIERFAGRLGDETALGVLDAGDLMSALVDELLTGYLEVTESIEGEIDHLDDIALRGKKADLDVLDEIVRLRRRISKVRRTLAPHRAALAALARPELGVDDALGAPWPGLVDRIEHVSTSIEALRTALLGTYDIHMGRVAQRANDVMKVLTLLSAVLLPAVVLAGIMGMNFPLTFFEDPGNFALVVAAMIVFSAVLLGIARWRGWW